MSDTTVANIADLNAAILAANALTGGSDTIELAGSIAMDGTALAAIALASGVTLTIEGDGNTLDGGGTEQGLFVYSGAVTVADLTIADALAQGENAPVTYGYLLGEGYSAIAGGGGGAGLGGGLFVGASASVVLENVDFTGDAAAGGAGSSGFEGQGGAADGGQAGLGTLGQGGGVAFRYVNGKAYTVGAGGGVTGGIGGGNGNQGVPTSHGAPRAGTGGGGLAAGGDIFVQAGGQLAIYGGSLGTGTLAPGAGGASPGSDIYIGNGDTVSLAVATGQTQVITGEIADQTALSGAGQGMLVIGAAGYEGAVLFTFDNGYSGGTDIEGASLQLGTGGTTGMMNGDVSLSGDAVLAFDRSDSAVFAGDITGEGNLLQLGSGTLTLLGTDSYTEGTTIEAGMLQLGQGGTLGLITGDISLATGAVLEFDRSDNVSLSGTISGGRLVQDGGGGVLLSGMVDLSGGLAVDAGALTLSAGSDVNCGITEQGGTLVLLAADSITGGMALNASAATLAGADQIFGGITLNNSALTLSAYSSVSGGVTIDNGTLAVLAGNSIAGGITLDGGALVLGAGNSISGGILVQVGIFSISAANEISGGSAANEISGGITLDTGVLTLSAANDITGGITLAGGGLALESAGAAGSSNIVFGPEHHLTLDIGAGDAPGNTIAGFLPTETIDLQGIGLATGATLNAGNTLLVTEASGTIALQLAADANVPGTVFELASDGAGGTDIVPVETQFAVSTEAQLNAALVQIALESPSLPTGDAITIALSGAGINLTSELEAVKMSGGGTLVIDGGGGTLDGLGDQRGLFIYSGNVVVENLTIANAAAIGGAGGPSTYIRAYGTNIIEGGGGGGAGLGGGLFVAGSANDGAAPASVTLSGVSFTDDLAQGGAAGYLYKNSSTGVTALAGGGGLGGNGGSAGGGGIGQTASGGGFTPYPPKATPGSAGIIPLAGGGGAGDYPGEPSTISNPATNQGYFVGAPGGGSGGGGGGGGSYPGSDYLYPDEYIGGGGGVGGAQPSGSNGTGGIGGFGGGGGAGYAYGGAGGFGGGGGAGYYYGGAGGFGGGGGAGRYGGGGSGGFGAGAGGSQGGGGGVGAGGDIFVQQGGTLVITGGSLASGTVAGGAQGITGDAGGGTAGSAYGSGIFLQGNETISLGALTGQTLEVDGVIADQSGSGGTGANAGLGGVIAGGGVETGTLLFTADNTYLGETSIESGTLQLGDGGTTGIVAGNVSIGADALLEIDRSDNITFASTISGAGALLLTGGDTLTLIGADDYTGGSTIAAGALQLGTGGSAGLITGDVSLASGTSLIIDHDDQVDLTGAITGAGGVTFAGGGVLTLAGANDFAGGISFVSGTLALESAGAAGSGVIQFGTQQGLVLEMGASDVPQNLLSGFAPGDVIDLQGFGLATGATLNAGGTLLVSGASGTVALTLAGEGSLAVIPFVTGSDGNGGTDILQLGTVYNVVNEAQLNNALRIIESFGAELPADTHFTINLPGGDFALNTALETVSLAAGQSLLINGAGGTLDGQGSIAGLVALAGSLTVENLTITKAAVTGSSAGGVGGPGLGGGLFAGADAVVTLQDVAFVNDSAIGGNGGSVSGTSDGGFGTGGGGAGGQGGFGAGNGATNAGGGGLGAGGDIFVQSGSTMVVDGGYIGYGGVAGGAGAQSGYGLSTGVFLQGTASIDFAAAAGQTLEVSGDIFDQTGAGEAIGQSFPAGSGSVIIGDSAGNDSGAVLFDTGAQYYTGGTDIESGTLITGGSGFFAGAFTIAQGGVLDYNGGGAAISGDISGDGSLVLSNGALTLSTANDFSGGVTINSGVLTLENAAGAGTGTIAFGPASGLELQIGAGIAPANVIAGFGFGETIDLQGIGTASAATLEAGNTLLVTAASGIVALTLAPGQSFAGDVWRTTGDGAGGTDITLLPSVFQVTDEAGLNAAITAIDTYATLFAAGTDFSISIATGDLLLTSALEAVELAAGYTLSIDGGGNTLDGGGTQRGLFIYAGNVEVSDLTIANATALGGAGGSGAAAGGGGAGLGGGLFVAGTANGAAPASVTLDDVTFSNDAARGGAAGTDQATAGGCGGGGGMGQAGLGGAPSVQAGNGGGIGTGGTDGAAGIIPGAGTLQGGTAAYLIRKGGTGGGIGAAAGTGARIIYGGYNGYAGVGGAGGFGGGGGGGLDYRSDASGTADAGGKGGFGGGGGGVGATGLVYGVSGGGSGGWGGGGGSDGYGLGNIAAAGFGATGGNGLGAGGDIFVQQGGTLIITGGSLASGTVQNGGTASGMGNAIFLQGNQQATFGALAGQTLAITGVISDQSGDGGTGANAGAGQIIIGDAASLSGTVILGTTNSFVGGITIDSGTLLLGAAGAAGSGIIDFGGGDPPALAFTVADAPTNTLEGFVTGDTIDITDLAFTTATVLVLDANDVLNVTEGTVSVALTFASAESDMFFTLASDGDGGTKITDALCFVGGTHIATPRGEVPVERLKRGDLVATENGAVAVRWIGIRQVASRFADPLRVMPIRIRAGALGDGLPRRDLLVSPCHAMYLEGILVQAAALVNGMSITRETAMPERFTYYHVEVEAHRLILAEGALSETFVDNVDRMAFDNWAEYEALRTPEDAIAEMSYPRAKSARQIPAGLRRRLALRDAEGLAVA